MALAGALTAAGTDTTTAANSAMTPDVITNTERGTETDASEVEAVSAGGLGTMHPDTLALPAGWRTEDFLLVASPSPAYPDEARPAGVQGIVRTLALVDSTGAVREVRVTRGIPELDSAAVAAIRAMRFRPRVLDGRAVAGWFRVPITFTLH